MSQQSENAIPIQDFSSLEKDNAIHSARYILEDISVETMAKMSGLPEGVINAAFRNIFIGGDV